MIKREKNEDQQFKLYDMLTGVQHLKEVRPYFIKAREDIKKSEEMAIKLLGEFGPQSRTKLNRKRIVQNSQ